MKCENCQLQLLPYLYELLEEQDRAETAEHLANCPACQEALRVAKEQQGMLAEAVKEHRAEIVFKAPTHETAVKAAAPTLVLPLPAADTGEFRPRRRALFLLNRWSIAAGIMLFVFSAGGVICWMGWNEQSTAFAQSQTRLAQAQQELAKTQEAINQKKSANQTEIRAIQQQIDKLFKEWKKEETTTRKVLDDKRVSLTIIGPQQAMAGANNKYQVQFANKDHPFLNNLAQQAKGNNVAGGPPQLQVRAVDTQTKKILFEQNVRMQGNQGQGNFEVPADVPFMPGQQVSLNFLTQGDDGKAVVLSDNLNLIFPEYVTHLTTDRPMYRPGETVRFRSLTLERFSLKPAHQPFHLRYRILGPRNEEIYKTDVASEVVVGKNKAPIRGPKEENLFGIGTGEFTLPANLSGGPYTLIVSEINDRFNEEKRSFLVHHWQAPRFSKDVQFHRSSYGAGDQVKVAVRVAPIQGAAANIKGAGANIAVTFDATIDGNLQQTQSRATDMDGRADFEFTLPPQILKGDGRVTITCNDGATHETIQRAIPIIARDLQVEFYPEGGDLIAGVPNRVYFQARTLGNRPADLDGRIVDDKGAEVTRIQTVTDEQEPGINQGLGSFTFTPQMKRRYSLRIDSPIGIERAIALPSVKDRGVVLNIAQGVVEKNEIKMTLYNVKDRRDLLVGAYCRGRLLGHQLVTIDANKQATVTLKPSANVGGVYRITVFEKHLVANEMHFRPLAERLIYRKNSERVDVSVESDGASYQPAESVILKLHARNEKKESVPAVALVAVVDNSVLKLVDDKKARSMPTHFLLTTEIRNPDDLESADVFLGDHPKAALSLDLLLGSQGWRRFAEQDPAQFQRRQQQAKQPVFLTNSTQVAQFLDSEQKLMEQLDQKFVTTAIEMQKKLAERERDEAGPPEMFDAINLKHLAVEQVRQEIASGEQSLRRTRAFLWQFVLGGLLLTLFFIGFYLLSVGLRRLSDGESPALWFVLGFGLFAFLFFASIIGTFALMGENLMDVDDFRFGGRPMAKVAAPAPVMVQGVAPQQDVPLPIIPAEEPNEDDPANNVKNQDLAGPAAAQQKGIDFENRNGQRFIINNPVNFWNGQNFVPEKFDPQDERNLRQQGQYQTILAKHVGRRVQLPAANDPSIVREYAHQRQPKNDDVRRDFAETVYWHPVLVMPNGQAQVKFDLSDSVTSYQVLVLSHTADGRLGSNQAKITAKLPFSINPTVPQEVTNNDLITIPVAVNNDSAKPTSVTLGARFRNLEIQDKQADRGLNLDGNQRKRELFSVKPTIASGTANVRMTGKTTGNSDSIERSFKVVQDGFPISGSVSGVLENKYEHEIILPEQWLPGSLKLQAQFYPSPLAELQNGLESMLREPNGCFEQSSSSNYPNVMILNLMKQNNQANPVAEKQARQLMQTGYQKLTSFECIDPAKPTTKRGYEWFGQTAPPHEALTAYGLMQFRDMAKVYRVEPDMLQRTEQFLLDQRDGKGGFKRNPRGLDQFGRAPDPVTNAYIVWALTESGVKDNLDVELTALRDQAKTSKDTYFLALAALSQLNRKKIDDGLDLLRTLQRQQKASGEIPGAQISITGSQGRDLLIETTALTVLGWLKANRPQEFHEPIRSSVKWLGQQRRDGSFGGTQSTILTLKAMVAFSQKNPRALQGGKVEMMVRDTQPREAAPPQAINQFGPAGGPPGANDFDTPDMVRATFSARSQDVVTLNLRDTSMLRPGKNLIELNVTGANQIPFSLTWSYRTNQPANDPKAPVKLTTKLSKTEAKEGEAIKLNALIENTTGKGQGMTVAVLGLPAGLALPDGFEQLKTLAQPQGKASVISAWELRGRELVLYWRDLAPDAKIALDLDLICRIPGTYRGPASRAYLYYDADRKYWVEPLGMRVFEVE